MGSRETPTEGGFVVSAWVNGLYLSVRAEQGMSREIALRVFRELVLRYARLS